MIDLSQKELAGRLEVSWFRPEATAKEVEQLCTRARERGIYGVCVPGSRVALAAALLEDAEVKVTGLVGFPLGTADSDVKRYETEAAIDSGAQEIELAAPVGRLKEGDRKYVLREFRDVAEAADERPVKIILEPRLLTREEMLVACELALDSGVQFVCAGGGHFGHATVEDIKLLRETVGAKFGVKAAIGGFDAPTVLALIDAGAARVGIVPDQPGWF